MPQIYKILTGILAFTGCLSLLITSAVNPLMSFAGIGIFPGYYRFLKGMPQAPKWVIGGLSVFTLFTYFVDAFSISNDYFLAVAHLTITFQAIKSFDLREPWDHLQVYFMSLLQLIIVSELTNSIVFGVIFVFFLVAFVTAMVLAHFVKEGTTLKVRIKKPVMSISVLTIFMTIIFFVSLPRISGGLWTKGHMKGIRTVGFSEKVEFGSLGEVKSDPTVVMRIEITGNASGPYYWRGMSLNYFDGISWRDTLKEKVPIYKKDGMFVMHPYEEEDPVVQKIFLEPMDTDVIFGLNKIAAVRSGGMFLLADSSGALFLPQKKNKRLSYTVYSIRSMPAIKGNISDYLQLPKGTEKISERARSVTVKMERDIDKATTIEKYLRGNFTYSLSPPRPREGISPVEDFLFHSRMGYCEHYASAMVLMLRALAIPARIVTGFSGGDVNEYGGYIIVRQSNAHSWVEAAIDGGWRSFDPTPPVIEEPPSGFVLFLDMLKMKWDRYVVSFSSFDQKEIVRIFSLSFWWPNKPDLRPQSFYVIIFLSVSILLLTLFFMRLLKLKRYGFPTVQYLKLRSLIKKKGRSISSASTPSEVAREATQFGMNNRIKEFITIYEECRFGGRALTAENRARYLRLLKEIKNRMKS
jgi:transglutaminase-like putative cysteine protease